MSSVARRIAASPERTSSDTWAAITKLICQDDSSAAAEFAQVTGIAACLINDEAFSDHPLVMKNKGPRLRIYCLYGNDAIEHDQQNEDQLSWSPTAGDWAVFLPCLTDDFEMMKAVIDKESPKFRIYDVEKGLTEEANENEEDSVTETAVDWESFRKL